MRRLFLHTGYLMALEASDDQHDQQASAYWHNASRSLPRLVTTSYDFDEVVTFFNGRNRHAKAMEIGRLLLESPSVKLIHVDEPLFHEAWRYLIQYSDKSYSLTDYASFVVMKRPRIRTALTFDQHFVQAGFEREPESQRTVLS